MAHECEECGQACYCDQDDTWFDTQPDDCRHLTEGSYCGAGWDENGDLGDYDDDDYDDAVLP